MHEPRERGSDRRRLAVAGFVAAGALLASTALPGVASADPTADDVRERVEQLEKEYAEQAETYNQAKQDHEAAQEKLEDIRADKKDAEEELDGMQSGVRELATAAYSGDDYTSVPYLATSAGPEDALRQASDLGYLSKSQEDRLDNYVQKKNKLERLETSADETEADAQERLDDAEEAKEKAEEKLDEQQELLDELSAEERAEATEGVGGGADEASSGGGGGASAPQGNGNAQAAIDFAYAQIGDSYSMGANGPDTWDCSSLMQAAWRQAGVSIPRVTYDQVNAGTRVSWDQMQPGDLIFFYGEEPSHVGMYVGGNKMVHASNPSKPVAEVELNSYYQNNFSAAVRVG